MSPKDQTQAREVWNRLARVRRARANAASARIKAEKSENPAMKAHLLRVAADYEMFANRAEKQVSRTKGTPKNSLNPVEWL